MWMFKMSQNLLKGTEINSAAQALFKIQLGCTFNVISFAKIQAVAARTNGDIRLALYRSHAVQLVGNTALKFPLKLRHVV
jgi:hypothetical protein